MRSVVTFSYYVGTHVRTRLTRRMLLEVIFGFSKVDQIGSIQLYKCLCEPFDCTSSCSVIAQVYLLEHSMTRNTASDYFGPFHSEGKFVDIAYSKLIQP